MNNGIQFVAGSSLAPVDINLPAACRSAARASVLHGLRANPERTGLIGPIEAGEIEGYLTIATRTSDGESLRDS